MTALVLFQYGDHRVRTVVDLDGDPWFVAADVCAVLGYSNTSKAVRDHVRAGQRRSERIATPGAVPFQNMIVINEGGLYRLIMRSDMPSAEAVQDWITDEVLPQIRRTGSYTVTQQQAAPAPTADPFDVLAGVYTLLRPLLVVTPAGPTIHVPRFPRGFDPDHPGRRPMPISCPSCGRELGPHRVLHGWWPCLCGGHRTIFCRDDTGGCGRTTYLPPLVEGRCQSPQQGFTEPPDA